MRPDRHKILCVEDDPDICDLLSLYLDEEFDIETANSLKEARQILEFTRFSLLLIDEQYPDGAGLDFIREIRASGLSIPIIYQSAFSLPEYIQKGLDAGASFYLVKPIEMDELVATIRRFLNREVDLDR
jgi:DNA-binding response OmpR family regulator